MTCAAPCGARIAALTAGVSLVVALLLGCGGPRDRRAATPAEMLVLSDGGAAQCVLVAATRPSVGGAVLLQRAGADIHDWQPLAARLATSAVTSLALLPPSTSAVPSALESGVAHLATKGVPPDKIAVVATGADCEAALAFAAGHPEVIALVLISPESQGKPKRVSACLKDYGKRPILLVTAEGDAFGNAAALSLKEDAQGMAELRQYPGMTRGTDLLALSESAVEQIAFWLDAVLTGRTPLQSSETQS